MKKLALFIFLVFCILGASIHLHSIGPADDDIDYVTTNYEPVILDRGILESSIKSSNAKPIEASGKIYIKGDYLFINEKYEGVHMINNSDPHAPVNIGFIEAPGCIDISIIDDYLFIDNAVDLVTVDIGSFPIIREVSRVRNIFPELFPPDLDYLPWQYSSTNRESNTVIVGWKRIVN